MLKSSQAAASRMLANQAQAKRARKSLINWITNHTVEVTECSRCGGTGNGGFFSSYCKACSGSGKLRVVSCPKCSGSGRGLIFRCGACGGYGQVVGDMNSLLSHFTSR